MRPLPADAGWPRPSPLLGANHDVVGRPGAAAWITRDDLEPCVSNAGRRPRVRSASHTVEKAITAVEDEVRDCQPDRRFVVARDVAIDREPDQRWGRVMAVLDGRSRTGKRERKLSPRRLTAQCVAKNASE